VTRRSRRSIEQDVEDLRGADDSDLFNSDYIWFTDGDGTVVGRSGPGGFDSGATAADLPDGVEPEDLRMVADFTEERR